MTLEILMCLNSETPPLSGMPLHLYDRRNSSIHLLVTHLIIHILYVNLLYTLRTF